MTKLPGNDLSEVTSRIHKAIRKCKTEEDVRVQMERIFRDALPDLPEASYEQSLKTTTFSGRLDAVHSKLLVEYKKPGVLDSDTKRTAAAVQLETYLTERAGSEQKGRGGLAQEECLSSSVGVVTDGGRLIFIQRRRGAWHRNHQELNEDSVEKLLLWLRSMNRKDLSPENLIEDFGPDSDIAQRLVRSLAEVVKEGSSPKAAVVFNEWEEMFGVVYGAGQLIRSGRDPSSVALAGAYHVEVGAPFPVLLFAVHTYYALLMKLLATELISSQTSMGDSFLGSLTRTNLRKQLEGLESGEFLARVGIRNAIEQDFFGWYVEAWSEDLHDGLWDLCRALLEYDVETFHVRPDRARDILKDLYHGLIPEAVRHALGEYYTPDWLAEHVLEMSGYDGNPKLAVLDASCGSGTFLVAILQAVREWLADNTVQWGSAAKKAEALQLIQRNVVGFDLNPLAVIASRTNYLFALGPLLRFRRRDVTFDVPVFLTDSVLLPGRTDDQLELFAEDTIPFKMAIGTFNLPLSIVDRKLVPEVMLLLHQAIASGHQRDVFLDTVFDRCPVLTPSDALKASLGELFEQMADLERQGRNRIWAKLIRNRYASLVYDGKFDFVLGNPPHVNWESLTENWRHAAENEYRKYGLFTLKGQESRYGGGKKDIAALFTYAVADHFLKPDGVISLVLHVSLLKTTGAAEGFRRFQFGDGKEYLQVREVHDFQSFQPFATHPGMRIKTRTVTLKATRSKKPTKYPVPYVQWSKTIRGPLPAHITWHDARLMLDRTEITAIPVRGMTDAGRLSPWLTVSKSELKYCRAAIAPPELTPTYKANAGFNTGGLNGAFFLEVLDEYPDGTLLVRNRGDIGKIPCKEYTVELEPDLVFPLVRGRCVDRWRYSTDGHVLLVQDPATKRGFEERWMQRKLPRTWDYLKKFEPQLRQRAAFLKYFDPAKDPFYSMYNIGQYSFAPHKVVWMDVSATMRAAVLSAPESGKMPMPEHKVMLVALNNEDEAHYVAGILNSTIAGTIISGYVVDNSLSTHPTTNVQIPKFDPDSALHQEVLSFSRRAHAAVAEEKPVEKIQRALDKTVKALYLELEKLAGKRKGRR